MKKGSFATHALCMWVSDYMEFHDMTKLFSYLCEYLDVGGHGSRHSLKSDRVLATDLNLQVCKGDSIIHGSTCKR
jgi:hypothetical protein